MHREEVLALFDRHGHTLIVRNKQSGIEYYLHRDIVENSTDGFVYGYFVKQNPRCRATYKWFFLQSVEFITGCLPNDK